MLRNGAEVNVNALGWQEDTKVGLVGHRARGQTEKQGVVIWAEKRGIPAPLIESFLVPGRKLFSNS